MPPIICYGIFKPISIAWKRSTTDAKWIQYALQHASFFASFVQLIQRVMLIVFWITKFLHFFSTRETNWELQFICARVDRDGSLLLFIAIEMIPEAWTAHKIIMNVFTYGLHSFWDRVEPNVFVPMQLWRRLWVVSTCEAPTFCNNNMKRERNGENKNYIKPIFPRENLSGLKKLRQLCAWNFTRKRFHLIK